MCGYYYTPNAGQETNELEFRRHIEKKFNVEFADYTEFHRWSCDNYEKFWNEISEEYVTYSIPPKKIVASGSIDARPAWGISAKLNFTQNIIEKGDSNSIAILAYGENPEECKKVTYDQLRKDVYSFANQLRKWGINSTSVVAAFANNTYYTAVAMFASAAVGACFTSCSTDYGEDAVLARFGLVKPTLFLHSDTTKYRGKEINLKIKNDKIRESLNITRSVDISDTKGDAGVHISDFLNAQLTEFAYEQVDFDSPLLVTFTSGTTGAPKAIVHGVGRVLLKHIEEHLLQGDALPSDRLFFYTTTSWMMYNWMLSFLLSGGSIVLFHGSPTEPTKDLLIQIAAQSRSTMVGMGSRLYDIFVKLNDDYKSKYDLSNLRMMFATGSPLQASTSKFLVNNIAPNALIASISGGTDIMGCFVGGVLSLPAMHGECQVPFLGMDVIAGDSDGKEVRNSLGELLCLKPFPSMPVRFMDDPESKKYRAAYFDKLDGLWAHGDLVYVNNETGGFLMMGRSDATLNRGGVRIGTAEIYSVVEKFPEIEDSIVASRYLKGVADEEILLFVKMAKGKILDADLTMSIKKYLRDHMSPRHVPDFFHTVTDIPYTISGKKMEVLVKKLLNDLPLGNVESVRNPECIDQYLKFKAEK